MSSTTEIQSANFEKLDKSSIGKSVVAECIGRGGKSATAEVFQSPGSIGVPLDQDNAVMEMIGEQRIILAICDYLFSLLIKKGEKIVYSRDSLGVTKGYTWYKNDGTILTKNDNGSIEMESGGDVIFHDGSTSAVKFDELKSGFDQLKSEFDAFVSVYNSHTHSYIPGVLPATPSAPPSASSSPSTASIDDSEVPEVKFP